MLRGLQIGAIRLTPIAPYGNRPTRLPCRASIRLGEGVDRRDDPFDVHVALFYGTRRGCRARRRQRAAGSAFEAAHRRRVESLRARASVESVGCVQRQKRR